MTRLSGMAIHKANFACGAIRPARVHVISVTIRAMVAIGAMKRNQRLKYLLGSDEARRERDGQSEMPRGMSKSPRKMVNGTKAVSRFCFGVGVFFLTLPLWISQ